MDYEKRFKAIREFLKAHEYLHSIEMMQRYPHTLAPPYHNWVKDIEKMTFEDLLYFERDYDTAKLQDSSLINFVSTCKELSQIPQYKINERKLPDRLKRKLIPKKIHEIQILKNYVDALSGIKTIIDIGSGAGHLSCALVHEQDKTSCCLDMNVQFQENGQKKINYWLPELKDKIRFINHKLDKHQVYPFDVKQNETLTIGLHSCGALSTYIIKATPKHLINFGCCYHKLKDEYNISKVAQQNPMFFSKHALTMAAKCLGTQTLNDLTEKFIVKRYRYPVHFFYVDNTNLKFKSLGNARPSDYQGSFQNYINQYCPDLVNLDVPLKEQEVNYYFKAGSIRAMLGRLIELYLVLDRVLFLQENERDAKLFAFFDAKLSPRNLGIII